MFLVRGIKWTYFQKKKKDSKYTNALSVIVIQTNKNKKAFKSCLAH